MDKVRSLYLEVLRIFSAFYVFIYHVGSGTLGKELYFSTRNFSNFWGLKYLSAHYFVIVFFVLSGFLISTSANRANITFRTFIIARLGRLYSVLIPALIFSFLVAFFLTNTGLIDASLVKNNTNLIARFILNITFLSQSWELCSTPPFNTPFWSVDYEFMYYLLIGAMLLTKNKHKLILILVVILISGPKVLLLAPAWLIGNLLYKMSKRKLLNTILSLVLFLVTLFLFVFIIINPAYLPLTKGVEDHMLLGSSLLFSWNYLSDYIFCVLVALNIYSFFGISKAILAKFSSRIIEKILAFTMKIGNCSYTLYLFHLPMLFLFASIFPYDKTNGLHQAGLITLVMVTVYFIARQTEWKVVFWRTLVEKTVLMGEKTIKTISRKA